MDINPVLFPQVTNRESWSTIIQLKDGETNELIDLTGVTFVCEVRRMNNPRAFDSGYGNSYDTGNYNDYGPVISLANDNGITILDTGTISINMTLAQMRSMPADTYSIALTATSSDGIDTRQVFLGQLPVLYGGVS